MDGLRLANLLMKGEPIDEEGASDAVSTRPDADDSAELAALMARTTRSAKVSVAEPPTPPNTRRQIINGDPEELFDWINPQLLYGRALGFRGNFERKLNEGDPKAVELHRTVEKIRAMATEGGWLQPQAVYQFLPVASEGNTIHVYAEDRKTRLESFTFPRQPFDDGLCLADYVRPIEDGVIDNLGFFVTTAGDGVLKRVTELRENGEYLLSHTLGAFSYELAEAFAEWLHARMRAMWGFGDPATLTRRDIMRAQYRGCRYSFGYPSCPDMSAQVELWRLIHPDTIGVELTESHMMEPEASVSALVFHHPDAKYFDVKPKGRTGDVSEDDADSDE